MKKIKSKKILKLITITLLVSLLLVSNLIWYHIYKKEKESLNNAIIPTLKNDYYSVQVGLTNYFKRQYENYETEKPALEEYNVNFLEDIPLITQNPNYPNGCEAASATMLLNYYGINITLDEFITNYLKTEIVYEKEGKRYGPNPASYYAGDPKDPYRGWGCFEPVIANGMNKIIDEYKKSHKYMGVDITRSIEKLPLYMYTTPLVIWVTIDYEEADEVYEWFSYDKKSTYTYPKNSHAAVLTGKDEKYYYINDPLKDKKNIPVEKDKLEKCFDSMGRQVIGLYFYDFSQDMEIN